MSTTPPDGSPIVEFMVRFGLADRLLAQHVDDGTGHCRACPIGNQAGFQLFPCQIHYYAVQASEVERLAPPTPAAAPSARAGGRTQQDQAAARSARCGQRFIVAACP